MPIQKRIYTLIDSPVLPAILLLALAVIIGYTISSLELIAIFILVIIIPGIAYTLYLYKYPVLGLFTALSLSFVVVGLIRYLPAPLGIMMDGFLFLTVIITLIRSTKKDLEKLNALPFYIFLVWVIYTTFQLFNPLATSITAWFYAIRGTSFNFLFIIILSLLLLKEKKQLNYFILIWMAWSLIACFWGFKQKFIGLDGAEQAWLAAGNATTHVLHGKLRVFSFYSDAGQYGAAMAHSALIALTLAAGPGSIFKRLILAASGLLFLYAMAISGTRGALFVLAAGGLVYLLVSRNFTILAMGIVLAGFAFAVLKYTHIGHGNYEIQRLRSALDTEDASLNVRRINQQILARHLADKPFGGGIGTSGYFGLRFSPDNILAQIPTDSWYVRIWVETGVVGLVLHAGGLLLLLITGILRVFRLRDYELRNTAGALLAGYSGIIFSSYGNPVLGQFPTIIVTTMSIALIWRIQTWDKPTTQNIITSQKTLLDHEFSKKSISEN